MAGPTGKILFAKGFNREAIEQFEYHLKQHPYDTEIRWWKVDAHALHDKLCSDVTASEFEEIAKRTKNQPERLTAWALADYCRGGERMNVLTKLKQIIHEHDCPRTYYWFSRCCADEEFGPKRRMRQKAVELDPENYWYRCLWAHSLQESGDLTAALEQYYLALNECPYITAAHLGMVQCNLLLSRVSLGDLQPAAREIRHHLDKAERLNAELTKKESTFFNEMLEAFNRRLGK